MAVSYGQKGMEIKIKKVTGREILDSRGNPTVEVDVLLTGSLMAGRWPRLVPLREQMRRS
jgi:hypothetical protein